MAQPVLEVLSLALADEVGDTVSGIGIDGDVYTAEQRVEAINRGRQSVYTKLLALYKDDFSLFVKFYPEFIEYTTGLTLTSNKATKPSGSRFIYSVRLVATVPAKNCTCHPIPASAFQEALANSSSPYYPDSDNIKFFSYGTTIEIFGLTITTGDVDVVYLKDLVDLTLGGVDITDPVGWHDWIIKASYDSIKRTLQDT